jgi:uncharacterized protein
MKAIVFIMAKAPRMGLSKTRLARRIGAAAAWRRNRALHALTLSVTRDPRWRTVLAVAPRGDVRETFGGLWPRQVRRRDQGAGSLGDRMGRLLHASRPGACVFIGTDCPGLTRALLWRAIRGLRKADAVFGPAQDGGYWLLGLRGAVRPHAPFEGVRWSTSHALADTRARLPPGARIMYLPMLADVD